MKIYSLLSIVLLGITVATISHADDEHKSSSHISVTEIKWEKSFFGPEIWKVMGDLVTGEHITYIKFPAGTVTPLHIHSSDYVGIDITGTTRHRIVGKESTNKLLPPGSHWAIKANEKHVSECLPGLECIMAIFQKSAFDFIPLGPSPFNKADD